LPGNLGDSGIQPRSRVAAYGKPPIRSKRRAERG
jgi:hypothetical protein